MYVVRCIIVISDKFSKKIIIIVMIKSILLLRFSNKDVFVIPHLYGELSQHRMGITIIQDKVFIEN